MAIKRGWIFVSASKKYHYFVAGKSICGRNTVFSMSEASPMETTGVEYMCCKSCLKKFKEQNAQNKNV